MPARPPSHRQEFDTSLPTSPSKTINTTIERQLTHLLTKYPDKENFEDKRKEQKIRRN